MQKGKLFIFYLAITFVLFSCSDVRNQSDDHVGHGQNMDGMDMANNPDKTGSVKSENIDLSEVVSPVNETVLATIKTIRPRREVRVLTINAPGIISYDPGSAVSISSRYSGRIDKLYVKYNFQEVKKGQKVMDVYSPELLTAQQNLLFLLSSDPDAVELIAASKQKLRLLGMTDGQINDLVRTKKTKLLVSIYAPANGHIHEMRNLSQINNPGAEANGSNGMSTTGPDMNITLREGAAVEKGQTLFSIVNTDKIWAVLKIYPEDILNVKLNMPVLLYPETQADEVIEGKVDFIEPVYEQDSRYLNVRVYLKNPPAHELKAGSLVKGKIDAGKRDGLWIPSSSSIDLGNNVKVAFVKTGNVFKVRSVKTGTVINNERLILEGLTESDVIAQDASFLIDSEGFIKTNKQ